MMYEHIQKNRGYIRFVVVKDGYATEGL